MTTEQAPEEVRHSLTIRLASDLTMAEVRRLADHMDVPYDARVRVEIISTGRNESHRVLMAEWTS